MTCHSSLFKVTFFLFVHLLVFNRLSFLSLWLKKFMVFNFLSAVLVV